MSVSYGGDSIVFADGSVNASGFIGHRNRIINGAMVIDQRNAGASVSITDSTVVFLTDRFRFDENTDGSFSAQQVSTAPSGFSNSLKFTVTSADTSLTAGQYANMRQNIEGFNTADLNWGTASAATVTLSFWVYSSLTGTFGGSLRNSASDRSYPFTYTINSANTWEKETITIPGDTTGTWVGATNGIGLTVIWGFGVGSTYSGTANAWQSGNYLAPTGATSVVGTNGATFYITGVQLERGSTASSFEYRSYGAELALCQRYYEIGGLWFQSGGTPSSQGTSAYFSVSKRSTPAVTFTNTVYNGGAGLTHYTPSISGYNTLGSFAYYFVPSVNAGYVTSNWIAVAEL
jgi:hypothetical protein